MIEHDAIIWVGEGKSIMPALMERTISVDRLLAQKADAKLRQYGWSLNDAIARTLIAIITAQGSPECVFTESVRQPAHRHPGGLRGRIHIASDFDETPDEVADLFENS